MLEKPTKGVQTFHGLHSGRDLCQRCQYPGIALFPEALAEQRRARPAGHQQSKTLNGADPTPARAVDLQHTTRPSWPSGTCSSSPTPGR